MRFQFDLTASDIRRLHKLAQFMNSNSLAQKLREPLKTLKKFGIKLLYFASQADWSDKIWDLQRETSFLLLLLIDIP